MSVGEQIRKLREQRQLSIRGLAEKSGLSHASVSKIEAGKLNPSLPTLELLASALGKSLDIRFVRMRRGK